MRPTYTVTVTVKRPAPDYNRGMQGLQPGMGVISGDPNSAMGSAGNFYPAPWDALGSRTGCDEVLEIVRKALASAGLTDLDVRLQRYEETA